MKVTTLLRMLLFCMAAFAQDYVVAGDSGVERRWEVKVGTFMASCLQEGIFVGFVARGL
jgi:hypothetical protein